MTHKHAMLKPLRRGTRSVVVDNLRGDGQSMEGTIHVDSTRYRVFFAGSEVAGCPGADPFVAIALLPALLLGADLRIEGPVAPETLEAAHRVQAQYTRWFPRLRPIQVAAPARASRSPSPGVVSLFSGGVDSFHSALQEHRRLTHLLFVHGFDIPLGEVGLRAQVATALRRAASELGLPLIEMETNARGFTEHYVAWDFANGAAIAAVVMALSSLVGKAVIPSSGEVLPPGQETNPVWGSHPELDPLWTTPEQEFVHHAARTGRLAKMRLLVTSETAMRHLRVCWVNPGGTYNCGRCEKCLRTLAGLRVLGAADRCRSFSSGLDLAEISRLGITVPDSLFWLELREASVAAGDQALASAISTALRYRHVRAGVETLRAVVRRIPGARWAWARWRGTGKV